MTRRDDLTEAQSDALKWLADHNGEGAFVGPGGTLLAAGEIAPHMRSTFNALRKLGRVEFYGRKRVRVV